MSLRIATLLLLAGLPVLGLPQDDIGGATNVIPSGDDEKRIHRCEPGPWGDLEYYYTYLEAPPHLMELVNTPSERTVWALPGKSVDELESFLTKAGVPTPQIQRTLQDSIPYQAGPNYKLFPATELINELTPSTRQIIYTELRKWPENRFHRDPVIIASGNVQAWFRNSDLMPETIDSIERLTYRIGQSVAFSDVPAILQFIENDAEERAFLKVLTRTRSLILQLRLSPDSDFEALKDYWSSGYKNKDILPFLESLTHAPQAHPIDVAHLLPPTPRKYLYSFPSFSLGLDGTYPDSFWTSLNFFNYLPNDEFDNFESVMAYARANYTPAQKPFAFGDLIIITDPTTKAARHACAFVADDIVYTKNSRSLLRPFMLMKFSDLLSRYADLGSPAVEVWRKIER